MEYHACEMQRHSFGKLLILSLAEKITIKYLHLSTHNKRKIFINIGTLGRLAHTYKSSMGPFGLDRGLPQAIRNKMILDS